MANDRPLAAHEILDALENVSDNEEDYRERLICILPPPVDPDCLTDEDSGEEDNVELNVGVPTHGENGTWQKNPVNWPDVQGACQDKRPIEWFENFLDEDVISLLVSESNKYAVKKNLPGDITTEDMKCFIGILLVSGYSWLPRRRMYWENSPDTKNELISSAMTRDRFDFIFRHLHVNDNLDLQDKYTKVRPLVTLLNKRFLEFSPLEEHYSVDEAMIPYYGRHGCKQHIKGATTMCNPIYKELGLGASVVLTFCDVLISRGFDLPYHVVFDIFFTGTPLLEEITKKGLRCTGTVRENRTSSCPLITSKLLTKMERGAVDYRTTHDNTFIIAKWHDNNIFSIASNAVGINPKQSAKRFSQSEKRNIVIEEPHMVSIYNKYMGGVDRSDENISHYRIGIRGKKWYMPLLTHMIDLAEHNAWQLYKINHGKLDHLGFRRRVAIALIESNRKNAKRGPSRPSHHEHADSRKDQMNHLVIPQSKQTHFGRIARLTRKTANQTLQSPLVNGDSLVALLQSKETSSRAVTEIHAGTPGALGVPSCCYETRQEMQLLVW
ncbi:unnamed protein product [Pieris brassicae]|uniref:PiggyBac transposable element-derived protein domain-containing protein n=1 Tax=Pieris brassicae TaxID=7116 RepID=A0A9P0TMW5_PIEBR|nr:unnamed protein product [Pieris brassicae]